MTLYHFSVLMFGPWNTSWNGSRGSAGCILAGFLLGREPFFRGKDNDDQLVRIALVLGTEGLHDFLRKYGENLQFRFDVILTGAVFFCCCVRIFEGMSQHIRTTQSATTAFARLPLLTLRWKNHSFVFILDKCFAYFNVNV